MVPSSRTTSTSTVGFPRLSRISRPMISDDLKNLFHGYRSPFQCERNTSAWMGCAANLRPGTGRRPFITIQNYNEMKSLCQAYSGKQRAEMCCGRAFSQVLPWGGRKRVPRRKTAGKQEAARRTKALPPRRDRKKRLRGSSPRSRCAVQLLVCLLLAHGEQGI